jgi:uncharacterized membrane protein AbrB (regulator of aidB expression)
MSPNLFTLARIVSLFTLVAFFSHLISKHKKLIKSQKEYILSNRTGLIRLSFTFFVLILAFYIIYFFYLRKDYPYGVLCIPAIYLLLKILSYDSKKAFFLPFVKGFAYFGLGIVNIFVIFSSEPKNTNDLTAIYFISAMCFFETIDYFSESYCIFKHP